MSMATADIPILIYHSTHCGRVQYLVRIGREDNLDLHTVEVTPATGGDLVFRFVRWTLPLEHQEPRDVLVQGGQAVACRCPDAVYRHRRCRHLRAADKILAGVFENDAVLPLVPDRSAMPLRDCMTADFESM